MICDLCGRTFEKEEGRTSCGGCASENRCNGVHCPHCYYEMIPRPAWMEKLFSFFERKSKESPAACQDNAALSLNHLEIRRKARVSHLQTQDLGKLRKILAMGVLPGSELTLVQKFPSHVFKIGESQFSVDESLASAIYVRRAAS